MRIRRTTSAAAAKKWPRAAGGSLLTFFGLLLVVAGALIAVATIASLVWSSVLFVEARLLILGAAGSLVSLGVLLIVLFRGKRAKGEQELR